MLMLVGNLFRCIFVLNSFGEHLKTFVFFADMTGNSTFIFNILLQGYRYLCLMSKLCLVQNTTDRREARH